MKYKKDKVKRRKVKCKSIVITMMLLIFTFSLSTVSAQEGVNASGGNASGSGGSASYSVGQMVYQTHLGTNGSITAGVQQPYEISVVTSIQKAKNIHLSISAYPNPTTNYLTLEIEAFELSNLKFQLYNALGKLLQNEKIIDKKSSIVMSSLAPGTYLLKIVEGNNEVKTFKIVKN